VLGRPAFGAWSCLLERPGRQCPRGRLRVHGISTAHNSKPGFLPGMGGAGYPRPCAAAHSEGGRMAFCGGSAVFPLYHGSPFVGGGPSSSPRCELDDGSSSRPVGSVGRGSPVWSTAPRIQCVMGPLETELAVVAREGLGLDPSWFDPMCEEVAACRRQVPHDALRLFPPVAQVILWHPPAGARVRLSLGVLRLCCQCTWSSHISRPPSRGSRVTDRWLGGLWWPSGPVVAAPSWVTLPSGGRFL
jgi:hypothetical protein